MEIKEKIESLSSEISKHDDENRRKFSIALRDLIEFFCVAPCILSDHKDLVDRKFHMDYSKMRIGNTIIKFEKKYNLYVNNRANYNYETVVRNRYFRWDGFSDDRICIITYDELQSKSDIYFLKENSEAEVQKFIKRMVPLYLIMSVQLDLVKQELEKKVILNSVEVEMREIIPARYDFSTFR